MKILEKSSLLNLLETLPYLGFLGLYFNIFFLKFFLLLFFTELIVFFRIIRRGDFHFESLKYLGFGCIPGGLFSEVFPLLGLLGIPTLFCLLCLFYPKREHLF